MSDEKKRYEFKISEKTEEIIDSCILFANDQKCVFYIFDTNTNVKLINMFNFDHTPKIDNIFKFKVFRGTSKMLSRLSEVFRIKKLYDNNQ